MIQHWFDCMSEQLERVLSTWWGVLGYFAACGACGVVWGWDGLDRAVYGSGAVIIVLLLGSARRDNKAAQAKLDKLTPGNELNRLEERSEREIEELRP